MKETNNTFINKLNHIRNLFLIGKSDGILDNREIQIISEVAKNNGINYKEVQFVLSENDLPLTMPHNEVERLSMLYDTVFLIVSDFNIHQNEKEMSIELAQKFEFNPQIIDALIEDILSFVIEGKDCDEAIVYLTKYLHPKKNLN